MQQSHCILKSKNDYLGANIQKYFKQDLLKDLDAKAKNKIFLLTDGYPIVEGKSARINQLEGLDEKFSAYKENTEVYFFELDPKDDVRDNEYSRIVSEWKSWLAKAGFKNEDEDYFQKNSSNLNSVKEIINKSFEFNNPLEASPIAHEDSKAGENCQSKLISLLNKKTPSNKKVLDGLIEDLLSACQVDSIIIKDEYRKKPLRQFILINLSRKHRNQYKIVSSELNSRTICYIVEKI
jgi:hypothetical protein